MTYRFHPFHLALVAAGIALLVFAMRASGEKQAAPASSGAAKPALTVTTTKPETTSLPIKITANGNVAAWQESSIATETSGLRLTEVRVNVGDVVKRGQVLAVFGSDPIQADLTKARAEVAEAKATLAEATANAQRARKLQPADIINAQQIDQYLTAELTAQARLEARRAGVRMQHVRIRQTQILAPDYGVISARSATVGAVPPTGQELFRLIRQGRLEWRAEVPSADLAALKPGMAAIVAANDDHPVNGTIRKVAPTIDAQTRSGLVYVDLPSPGTLKAGMFARGEFEIGNGQAMTLPQSAVLLRDGYSYVLRVGADSGGNSNYKVIETKVTTGHRSGDRIQITGGLDASALVVAAGTGFLTDGDTVHVVDTPAVKPAAASAVRN